jgi:hypothetical protein
MRLRQAACQEAAYLGVDFDPLGSRARARIVEMRIRLRDVPP